MQRPPPLHLLAWSCFVASTATTLSALHAQSATQLGPRAPSTPAAVDTRFAVIGDYGVNTASAANVGQLVTALTPHFIITVGDNNYRSGARATIDLHIGQYYAPWIHPYVGAYPSNSVENRFFPSLGNHDWATAGAAPYLAYFTLPGNERYYDFGRGPVHLFAVDSDPHEPDGISASSPQAVWLQSALAASNAPFKIVYFHHPPYSSAVHGNTWALQWPFRAWGADAVLAGHDHDYERFLHDGFPYFVNGLGGNTTYDFRALLVGGSEARFNEEFGAMLVEADAEVCTFRFLDIVGTVIDECRIRSTPLDEPELELVAAGSTWKYKDDGTDQGTAWRTPAFDDSTWASGPAQLGYGDADEATVIQGGPSTNRFATSYFRRTFQAATPADFRVLRLELVRDDGAAVFVNGVEVVRDNLASNATFASFALSTSSSDENRWHPYDVPASVLVLGTNTIAVEVHQVSATSSDLGFDLRLAGVQRGQTLLARGANWKYRDNGIDPGPSWKAPTFDDSTWPSGPAQLGYGEGDEQTLTSFGPNPLARPITTWFRGTFQVANPSSFDAFRMELLRDDAAVVWINGKEALRSNLNRTSDATTTAGYVVSGADEGFFVTTLLDPRLFEIGTNVIAVEIHQFDAASSDLSFDLALYGL